MRTDGRQMLENNVNLDVAGSDLGATCVHSIADKTADNTMRTELWQIHSRPGSAVASSADMDQYRTQTPMSRPVLRSRHVRESGAAHGSFIIASSITPHIRPTWPPAVPTVDFASQTFRRLNTRV